MPRGRRSTASTAAATTATPLDIQPPAPPAKINPIIIEPSAQAAIDASKAAAEATAAQEEPAAAVDTQLEAAVVDEATAATVEELAAAEANGEVEAQSGEAAAEAGEETAEPQLDVEAAVYSKQEASEIAQKAVRRALSSKRVKGLQDENDKLRAELQKMQRNEELDKLASETGVSRSLLEASKLTGEDLKSYAATLKSEIRAASERQVAAATRQAGSLLRSTVEQQSRGDAWAAFAADLASKF